MMSITNTFMPINRQYTDGCWIESKSSMKKKKSNTANTKKRIMDGFWDIYKTERIDKMTVKQICQNVNIHRSTFYEYFLDIYDVLEQIELSLIPNMDNLPPIKAGNKSIGMPVDMFLNLFDEKEEYYKVLLGENGDPSFVRKLKDSTKPVVMNAVDIIGNMKDSKIDFIIEYTLSAMIGTMQYWFDNKDRLSSDELIELISNIMDKGVTQCIL